MIATSMPQSTAPIAPAAPRSAWRPRGAFQWLLLNVAAALSYWAMARVGLALAIGPADVSVLWLPNGLALALVLVWGAGVLPGLVLGSLIPATLFGLPQDIGGLNQVGISLLVRLGSAGQWWAMVLLLGDWQSQLTRDGSRLALRFALGALCACTLAPTVGMATLLSVGQITQAELLSGWLAWWVGDSAGMLVATPLLLPLLHPGMRRHVMGNQTFPTLALGLGLTLAGTAVLGHQERAANHDRAGAESRAFAQGMTNLMALAEADLARLAALHYRIQLELGEFEREAGQIRRARDWLSGFAYLRWLTHPERPAFEASLEQSLRSVLPDGNLQRAPAQSSYWAVARLSPIGGQEARLGVDEGSEPRRRIAIERALGSDRAAATPVLDNLVFAAGDEWGVMLYLPVFEGPLSRAAGAKPTGVVSATVQLKALVAAALRASPALEFPTLLLSSGPASRAVLVIGDRLSELDARTAQEWLRTTPERDRLKQTMRIGDTDWQVHSRFANVSLLPTPSPAQLGALALGLGCTALLTALQMARARRDRVLERWQQELRSEVAARTEELSQLNEQLQHEVEERAQGAEMLRQNAAQLAQREALLRALLRAIPDPVWLKDLNGRYLIVNEALASFVGRPAKDLIGHDAREFVSAGEAEQLRVSEQRAMSQRDPILEEAWQRNADGQELLQVQLRVGVRDDSGRLIGLLGLAWDITEQRRKELALQRFRWLADSAAQGFALATPDGQVEYLNATALRWLGESDWHEGSRRHARRFFAAAEWRRLRDEVMPRVHAEGSWSGMLAPRDRQRRLHRELLSNFFLLRDAEGQPRYVGLLLTDLSERLTLEAELAQARDRAEEANRAKSVFLSNISHEIRTPLNAVLGYAQLLHEDERLGAQARAQVESIHQAGTRLLRLINDVLDLSKIEAGALQLSPEPFELAAELRELHRIMQGRASQAQLQLQLELGEGTALVVMLDRGKFGQVLLNLLGNAIKFSPVGGRVRLSARVDPGPTLLLSVDDEGPGIAADELAQLFQPFRQGESGARRGGTGLGLALSRKLVQSMGGELSLDSRPGQGTRALLRLPLPLQASRRDGEGGGGTDEHDFAGGRWRLAPGTRCRVLIAEDDPDSRRLLVAMLERLGCEVGVGEDGRQALALAERQDFDIVLSDMRMPEMDGVALREALRALPRCQHWPVVAVTASSLLLGRDDFLRLGFADYVPKPYAFAQMLAVLRQHAGAQLERLPASVDAPLPAAASPLAGEPADLRQAMTWASEGRAMELRQWLAQQTQLPTAVHDRLSAALARYDLQTVETLLSALLQPPA